MTLQLYYIIGVSLIYRYPQIKFGLPASDLFGVHIAGVAERSQHDVPVGQDRDPRDGAMVQRYPEPALHRELESSAGETGMES